MTATFRVMLTMQIRPELAHGFEQVWEEVGTAVTSHPANRGQILAKSHEEANTYYIVSDWIDEASFREFEHSKRHVDHRTILHPYRIGGTMQTMSIVASLDQTVRHYSHDEWEKA